MAEAEGLVMRVIQALRRIAGEEHHHLAYPRAATVRRQTKVYQHQLGIFINTGTWVERAKEIKESRLVAEDKSPRPPPKYLAWPKRNGNGEKKRKLSA